MARAVEVGKAYVQAVNDKDIDSVLSSFEPDGVLYHPFGTFAGHEKISEFYTGLVFHADTDVTLTDATGDDKMSCLELIGISPQAPDQPQYACDVFKLNAAGKIETLRIYYLNTVGG